MPLPRPPSAHVIHRLFEPIGAPREQNLLMMHPSGSNYWTRTSGFLTVGFNARSRVFTFTPKEKTRRQLCVFGLSGYSFPGRCVVMKLSQGHGGWARKRYVTRGIAESLHMTQQTWEETSSCRGNRARQRGRTQRTQQCHFSQGNPPGITMRTLKAVSGR